MSALPTSPTPLGRAVRALTRGAVFSGGRDGRSLREAVEIPEAAVEALPGPVARIVATAGDPRLVRFLVAAAIAVASACLPNVFGWYADRRYAPTLFCGLVAPAGSNKGLAARPLRAVRKLDRRLREASQASLEALRAQGKAPEGAEPVGLGLPADASAAGITQALALERRPFVVHETEIDAMVGGQSQDWRQTSPFLRRAGEHEPINVIRKGYAYYVDRPEVALLIAGTNDQLRRLIPSAEDGLYSRVLWTYGVPVDDWISPRPRPGSRDLERDLDAAGADLDRLHAALSSRERPLEVRLEERHWDLIDAVYADVKEKAREAGYGATVDSIVHRSGVAAFRVAMLTAVLSRIDEVVERAPDALTAADADVELGLALALVALDHGLRLHGLLPSHRAPATPSNADVHQLLEDLPEEFTRATAIEVGDAIGIAKRTVDLHLSNLTAEGLLLKARHGRYRKPGEASGPVLSSDF